MSFNQANPQPFEGDLAFKAILHASHNGDHHPPVNLMRIGHRQAGKTGIPLFLKML
jgi:hypothetical protein